MASRAPGHRCCSTSKQPAEPGRRRAGCPLPSCLPLLLARLCTPLPNGKLLVLLPFCLPGEDTALQTPGSPGSHSSGCAPGRAAHEKQRLTSHSRRGEMRPPHSCLPAECVRFPRAKQRESCSQRGCFPRPWSARAAWRPAGTQTPLPGHRHRALPAAGAGSEGCPPQLTLQRALGMAFGAVRNPLHNWFGFGEAL